MRDPCDIDGGRPRAVRVWDLPTRLFHWTLVALFAVQWITGKAGRLDLHMKLGAAVLALLLFRLAWGVVGSRTARFADFLAGPRAALAYLRLARMGQPWPRLGHNPLGGWSVAALIGLTTAQAAAGLFATDDIATEGPLAWAVSAKASALLSSLHRMGFKLLLALVALHVGAILFYRFAKGDDLVRPMLSGRRLVSAELAAKAGDGGFRSPWLALALLAAAAAAVFGGLAAWGR